MLKLSRTVPAALAITALTGTLAACGGDSIPGDAVVRVADTSIKKDDFTHWLQVAALSTAQQSGAKVDAKTAVPDAPDFKACIAAKRKAAPKPAKGQPKTTDATLKGQCKTQYTQLRDQVLNFLIVGEWLDGEAKEQKVKITEKDVDTQFATQKKQSFPKDSDYRKYLKDSGQSETDLRYQIRVQVLQDKLRAAITKGKDKVSDAQIAAYYAKNKAKFATPETRDLRVVLTKDEAKAKQALSQLKSGASFASVAKKYSIDTTSKAQGGKLAGVAKGQQEKALDAAVFAAAKGKLSGPVKTQFGFYVFEVTKITAAKQSTQQEASAQIKQVIATDAQNKALTAFSKSFEKEWKAKTQCREEYRNANCKNAPKSSTTATAATTPAQ